MKYLIVGGVAGGATTAARLRRISENSEIIMFERGEYISYANCGLPYYIGDVITERDNLFVTTAESFNQRYQVTVRTKQEVVAIFPKDKTVRVKKLDSGEEYSETYDKLVLSPGAEPLKPPIPGINDPAIFTIRNVMDTDKIKNYINANGIRKAVVVGAGFIGLEMAENLHNLGVLVTIVEMAEQVMTPLDFEMAAGVHQHLKTKNVEFYLKDGVASFIRNDQKLSVRLNSGQEIPADMVILSIGVRPESRLAKEAGLEIGSRNGIVVDDFLQTSDPEIYAVGDAIEFNNRILNKKTITYLAGPANKQGRICADNIVFGNKTKYKGAIGTAIAKVFDLTVASTGLSEKVLKSENIPYLASITHGSSHAGYYPDALPLSLKILFSPTDGKLLGAQIVGYDGIDKRIDLIAAVMWKDGTIYDLMELEHAYAPPFSSAKDPVNIAGFVAEDILTGKVKVVQWNNLLNENNSDLLLVDVRTQEEFELGSIEQAINIPVDNLRSRITEIPKDKKVVIFCGVGLRGYIACRILYQSGYSDVYNLSGGYKTYQHVTQKQSNEDIFGHDFIGKDDLIYQAETKNVEKKNFEIKTIKVDACGLQCPGPIIKLKKELDKLSVGDRIEQVASDPGFYKDVQSWCNLTGNKLVSVDNAKGKVTAIIEKLPIKSVSEKTLSTANGKTLIVFSDDFDKALASFVIANGAASTGKKVTMFFTFWGLSVVKKQQKPPVVKDFMGKMFGIMLPAWSDKLKLSKMNMLGMGTAMMKMRMKAKNVDNLQSMINTAIESGVEMIACQMSMDMMGIHADELMEGVKIGGVAAYLEEAEKSNINLFI